jgi:hypothetical protein
MSDEAPTAEGVARATSALTLTLNEARVLGCLLEKEATTPDQYPLSPNSLWSACNQSSNRDPVMDLGTDEVEEALEGLRYKQLGFLVHQAGARVPKAKHNVEEKFPYLNKGQRALLCLLLLRGAQSAAELRQRTERMHAFADLDRVTAALEEMIHYQPQPLVRLIPTGAGRRAVTYQQLLCGEVDPTPVHSGGSPLAAASAAIPVATWRDEMSEEIAGLRNEIADLREEIGALKSALGV